MIKIGDYNELEVVKHVDFGIYLDGGAHGEILMPIRYVPEGVEDGQDLEVFIYCDSEDRLIATSEKPKAKVGDFACLEVKSITEFGAFLDWGLPKDLFVPFREQAEPFEEGESYVVYIYLDETSERIVASSRLKRFLQTESEGFEVGQEVEILVARQTDLGYKVIVNKRYWGLLYENQIFGAISIGEYKKAYIHHIREDLLLDISLQPQGYRVLIPKTAEDLLEKIKSNNGFLPLTDKSAPGEIYAQLNMSKKAFKKAIGLLYKKRLITLEANGIRLVDNS